MRTVFLLQAVFLVETVNTSTGVNKLLLAGVERVTLGANFNLDVLLGRTSLNNCTTRASDSRLFVLGMDTFLHGFHLSHQISVKRQTALPLVQTPRYSITARPVLQVFFSFLMKEFAALARTAVGAGLARPTIPPSASPTPPFTQGRLSAAAEISPPVTFGDSPLLVEGGLWPFPRRRKML